MQSLGQQIIAEFYGCDSDILNDVPTIERVLMEAARLAGATIVSRSFHHFNPYGVSGAVIIAESHLTIHTWPEHGYAAVDLFTCGDSLRPEAAYRHLKNELRSIHGSTMEIKRGQIEVVGKLRHKPEPSPSQRLHASAGSPEEPVTQGSVAQS